MTRCLIGFQRMSLLKVIRVTDIAGQVVIRMQTADQLVRLNTADLPIGSYIISAHCGGKNTSQERIKGAQRQL